MSDTTTGIPGAGSVDTEEITVGVVIDSIEILVANASKILRVPEFQDKIEQAQRLFFATMPDEELMPGAIRQLDQNNFIYWLLLDFPLGDRGETAMKLFLDSPASRELTPTEREIGEKLVESRISLYDVISADKETNDVALRDLFTMGLVRTEDAQIGHLAGSPIFFALRMIKIASHYFSAGDLYAYPVEIKEKVLLLIKNQLMDPRALVPAPLKNSLKKNGYIFNHIKMMLQGGNSVHRSRDFEEDAELEEEREQVEEKHAGARSMEIPEAPPEETPARAHFTVSDFDGVRKALDSMKLAEKIKEDEKSVEYSWFKSPAHRNRNEVDGTIQLTASKLIIESLGMENLEAAKNSVARELRPFVKHLYDNLEKRRNFAR